MTRVLKVKPKKLDRAITNLCIVDIYYCRTIHVMPVFIGCCVVRAILIGWFRQMNRWIFVFTSSTPAMCEKLLFIFLHWKMIEKQNFENIAEMIMFYRCMTRLKYKSYRPNGNLATDLIWVMISLQNLVVRPIKYSLALRACSRAKELIHWSQKDGFTRTDFAFVGLLWAIINCADSIAAASKDDVPAYTTDHTVLL